MRPNRSTTSTWLAEELRRAVLAGDLPPGQPLRQEHLAAKFGVSPIPVREALAQLEAEGFVAHRPYRGAVVRPLSVTEALELLELRRLLEPPALRLAARHLTEYDLEQAAEENEQAMQSVSATEWLEHYLEFHRLLLSPSGHSVLVQLLMQVYVLSSRQIHQFHSHPAARQAIGGMYGEMLAALRRGDVDGVVMMRLRMLSHAIAGMRTLPAAEQEGGRATRASDRPRRQTTTDRLVAELRRAMLSGELPAGRPLRQAQVAARYGASSIPLREALLQLEAEGFVELLPYRGAVVRPVTAEEAEEIMRLRRLLDPYCLRLAIGRGAGQNWDRAESEVQQAAQAGLDEWIEHYLAYYRALYGPTGRPVLLALVDKLHMRSCRYLRLFMTAPERRHHVEQGLLDIVAATRRGDLPGAITAQRTGFYHSTALAVRELADGS